MKNIYRRFYHWWKAPAPVMPTKRFDTLIKLVENYSHADAPEVLLFGDSVMERISRDDTDQRTLGDMLIAQLQPDFQTCCISHSAYQSEVYYFFCKVLEQLPLRPKWVILPVNVRSFSPQWDLNPTWSFDYQIEAIQHYLKHGGNVPDIPEQRVGSIEEEVRFRQTSVRYPCTSFQTVGEFLDIINSRPEDEAAQKERKRQIFVFNYLHPLSSNHPKVIYLKDLIHLLAALDINLMMYITPVNYQAGNALVDSQFQARLAQNVVVLAQLQSQHIDFSCLLDSTYFFHPYEATEHLNQEGRRLLAAEVVQTLRKRIDETTR